MKRLALLIVALAAMPALASDKAAEKGGKDEAFKALLASVDSALSHHDAKAVGALFAEDGTFVSPVSDGQVVMGRAEVMKVHEAMFAGPAANLTSKHTLQHATWVGKDTALLDCSVELSGVQMGPPGAPAPTSHAVVLVQQKGGKWHILAARPYSVMPPPPAPPKT
jgi:uncharacterized protein (TIGR02246 family)